MKISRALYFLVCICLSLATHAQEAQSDSTTHTTDTTRIIHIVKSDIFRRLKNDSTGDLNVLIGNVVLKQENSLFYCDSAIQDARNNQFEAFGKIHINDSDSVHTYSEYLKYTGNNKMANLRQKVKLTDGKAVLTTEVLDYDMNAKIGTYYNGGKVVNGKTVLTSRDGFYYADTKEIYFQNFVKVLDPAYSMATDTLLYNLKSETATFLAATTIKDDKSRIRTKAGYYDLKAGKAHFTKRPIIDDSTQLIIADTLDYDKKTSVGIATGNVFYRDSAQGVTMLSGGAKLNNDTKAFVSYKKPLMILKQDSDSMYIAADTLLSAYHTKDTSIKKFSTDTLRYFKAFHTVRMFSDSLQGKCDSLYYSTIDSVFRFFHDPVMWTRGSQITGDTISLATKNRKPDLFYVSENAFSINAIEDSIYNQLRGNTLTGYFLDGEIDHMRAKGNSESVYYLQDQDSAYVGMSYEQADAITMRFIKRELKRVTWVNGVVGTIYPFSRIPTEKKQLRGFKWLEAERPKSAAELFAY